MRDTLLIVSVMSKKWLTLHKVIDNKTIFFKGNITGLGHILCVPTALLYTVW